MARTVSLSVSGARLSPYTSGAGRGYSTGMAKRPGPRRGGVGRVLDVQFVEAEFEAPVGTRMVIELEGGIRLVLADEEAIPLAACLLEALVQARKGGQK